MPDTVAAIIVAAGSSTRMSGADKLFAAIAGRPLLAHTVSAFERCGAIQRIALVLSAENLERGHALIGDHGFTKVSGVCKGGPRRQDSVRLGLEAVGPCDYVAIHDGARPLVTPELIERGIEAARETGAAVPAIPLADTIKEANADGTVLRTVDRSRLHAVQTPQLFRYDVLLRAHREVTDDVTDDAAMVEALGVPVKLFEGNRRNFKITTSEDLALAAALMRTDGDEADGVILHIARRSDWERAKSEGAYRGDTLQSDGFIHCSTLQQVVGVANATFHGQEGLVLLCIDSAKVAPDIRWEGDRFPHVYGPLNTSAISQVLDFKPRSNGTFELPAGLAKQTT